MVRLADQAFDLIHYRLPLVLPAALVGQKQAYQRLLPVAEELAVVGPTLGDIAALQGMQDLILAQGTCLGEGERGQQDHVDVRRRLVAYPVVFRLDLFFDRFEVRAEQRVTIGNPDTFTIDRSDPGPHAAAGVRDQVDRECPGGRQYQDAGGHDDRWPPAQPRPPGVEEVVG